MAIMLVENIHDALPAILTKNLMTCSSMLLVDVTQYTVHKKDTCAHQSNLLGKRIQRTSHRETRTAGKYDMTDASNKKCFTA